MKKKSCNFCINQLFIDDGLEYDVNSFDNIISNACESNKDQDISIMRIHKEIKDDRFITIYVNKGNQWPYSPTVITPAFDELKNPRSSEEIELDAQIFLLIDTHTKRIYISDQKLKNNIILWLGKKIQKKIFIKSILKEEDFIKNLSSVSEISFSIEPDLLNSGNEDILSHNLVKDIFGFGAETAKIVLKYKSALMSNRLMNKIKELIGKRYDFKNLVIIGRDQKNFENTFNLDRVISKIIIPIEIDENSKLIKDKGLFQLLISEIKIREKTL